MHPNEVTADVNCPLKGRKLHRRGKPKEVTRPGDPSASGRVPQKTHRSGNERTENTKRVDKILQCKRDGAATSAKTRASKNTQDSATN